jgi:hypothetical protein
MTAAEGSFIGLAKQTAKGTPMITDASYKYLLVRESSMGPSNMAIPLDREIGGGALLRAMVRVGVTSGGVLDLIYRPETIGHFLLGALGKAAAPLAGTGGAAGSYSHVFTMDQSDNFAAPYFTFRNSPGGAWGEQYQDCRVSAFAMNFRAARYVDGQVGFTGGLPTPVTTTSWAASTAIDGGPQFLASTQNSTVELPTGTPIKVLGGSFVSGMAIPLDEQWVIGSYSPDAMDITSRSFALNMTVKVADNGVLYKKMMYDPAGGNAWLSNIFREGKIKILLNSDQYADTAGANTPYSLQIEANGQSGASSNVYWSCAPIGLRAGRQLVMAVSAVFTADPRGLNNDPIKITLVNQRSTQY